MPFITTPNQYIALHGGEQSAKWNIVKQFIAPEPDELLLDAGSGPVAWWKGWHSNTVTIDPFFRPPGKMRIKGCAESLPLQQKSVDYTVAVSSIHLTMPLDHALAEIARVTKRIAVITLLKGSRHAAMFNRYLSEYFFVLRVVEAKGDDFYLLKPIR